MNIPDFKESLKALRKAIGSTENDINLTVRLNQSKYREVIEELLVPITFENHNNLYQLDSFTYYFPYPLFVKVLFKCVDK